MSLWRELSRRSVFKVGVAFLAFAWLIVQVASIVLPAFQLPAWVMPAIIVVFAIALPVVLVCAWVYELTPQGLVRTHDLPPESIGPVRTARRLDFAIIDRDRGDA